MSNGHIQPFHVSARKILKELSEGKIKKEELSSAMRVQCVRYFMEENPEYSTYHIAEILGTTHTSVSRWRNSIYKEEKWIVETLDTNQWATKLVKNTYIRIQKLLKQGKYTSASLIEFRLFETLMKMGYMPQAPIEIKTTDKMTVWDLLMEATKQQAKEVKDVTGNGKLIAEQNSNDSTGSGGQVEGISNGATQHSEEAPQT